MNITFLFHIICVHINPKGRLHKYLRSRIYSSYFRLFIRKNYQLQSNFMRWPIAHSFICVFVVQQGSNPRTWKHAEFPSRRLNLQATVCISPGSSAIMLALIIWSHICQLDHVFYCRKESTISKHGLITTQIS